MGFAAGPSDGFRDEHKSTMTPSMMMELMLLMMMLMLTIDHDGIGLR